MKDKELTQKENLFCTYYSINRSPAEAATKAGYNIMPERTAMKLLRRENIKKRIASLSKDNRVSKNEVEAGLRRIAFGAVVDAVKLAFSEDFDIEEVKNMDLFAISEIKVTKGKGVEIKFFDRIKALEKLSLLVREDDDAPSDSFFRAIEEGAAVIRAGCDDDKE